MGYIGKFPKGVLFAGKVFVFVLLAEIFLFNYRHFASLSNKEITDGSLFVSAALERQGDGTYLALEGEQYLEFTEIDTQLDTAFLDVILISEEGEQTEPVVLYQAVRDASHEEYYAIPDREIWHSQPKSQYLTYHLYGECKSLRLTFDLEEGTRIQLRYRLNPVIPLFFSWWRVGALWGSILLLYLLRPSSAVYKGTLQSMGKDKKTALAAVFVLGNMLLFYVISGLNPFFQKETAANQQEYQRLAEALSEGQLFLKEEPAKSLQNMENPYDYVHRANVLSQAGESFLWDHAYYEGKYYVYFGVVPAVLLYLPYYLLTGNPLPNRYAVLAGAFLLLSGLTGVMGQIAKRWFRFMSPGVFFLLSELMVTGCGLLYMCKRTDLYTVPIIMGLGFGFLGLWCFLCAEKEGKLSPYLVGMGSLFTALVAGCRPQLFLIVLLAVLLLPGYVFSLRYLKTKEGRQTVAAFGIPMITVAALLMWYNYARFGSVFDFGANYNLCFNDMRGRGFVWDRIPLGIWAYLFAPVRTILDFPFVQANYFDSNYPGITISEATYGGIFAVNLFVWMCPVLIGGRKYFKRKEAARAAFLSLIIGIIILCVDTEMSGILMRYFSDFSIFFLLCAALSWLLLYETAKGEIFKKVLLIFLEVSLVVTAVYQGCIFFLDTGEALKDLRADLFSFVKYQVMFWL